MFFSIKYKENEEKYIKLFGNIKEKCYFSRSKLMHKAGKIILLHIVLNCWYCSYLLGHMDSVSLPL